MPRTPTVTADGAVEAIREAETPFASTGQLADHFDVTRQAIRDQRDRLATDPRIEIGSISNNTVFYLSGSEEPRPGDMGNEEVIAQSKDLFDDDQPEDEPAPDVESAPEPDVRQSPPPGPSYQPPDRETAFRRNSLALAELSLVVLGATMVWAVGLELLAFAGLVSLVQINPVPVALMLGLSALGLSSGLLGFAFAPIIPRVESALGITEEGVET